MQRNDGILVLNAGSSSLKFAAFQADKELSRSLAGKFSRIGLPDAEMSVTNLITNQKEQRNLALSTHADCVLPLLDFLKSEDAKVNAIAHRVVHGGPRFREPQRVSMEMLAELRRFGPLDPDHLPAALGLIEEIGVRFPNVPQVACFDTAFHRDMPRVAKLLPLPRHYDAMGVQRYGFHGLSYAYLMQELETIAGANVARGKVILAHLGNGASMAAVRDGKSIDTTMAFTPTAGLVMSTRTGDLDPGLVMYLGRSEGMSADQFNELVNKRAGLLGVSEISPDVRDLLEVEPKDIRASEALALFCYSAKKWIGALAAALGGLDTLVFSGGIGENAPAIRWR
ncbi:MAG TPA: acetate/propionate family kinase, partial [Verrucomicrobiae bacterium]|nr:acetate/propionate family kinase [Verrucomicrobiae bacterium]